jgi:ATP-binding cassette subfamily C protein CydD
VAAPGRGVLAPAHLSLTLAPGEAVALVGANGAGKSTAVQVLLGLVRPTEGRALVVPVGDADPRPVDLDALDAESFWAQVRWVPQRPHLPAGTVREAVLGVAAADDARLADAARLAALDEVVASLPDGWGTRVGRGGLGLSVGQRQRVALAAALVARTPVVVLDEPTAHLDDASEEAVVRTVRALRDEGRAVLVVAHRPALVAACDRTVEVRSAPLAHAAAVPSRVPA